jgi:formylglycine-generating enzyme required for sulfatase activity
MGIRGARRQHDGLLLGRRDRHGQRQLQRLRQPVGRQADLTGRLFAANPFGLYDMAGNVFQWVQDCFQSRPPYEGIAETHGVVVGHRNPMPGALASVLHHSNLCAASHF